MRRLFLLMLCLWCTLLIAETIVRINKATDATHPAPFGVMLLPDGTVCVQDFSYNLLFLKCIQKGLISRPYRLEDQEKAMRQIVPQGQTGMSHAYSPVAFVLAQPFLCVSGYHAYLSYSILCTLSILLLFSFHLLPRVDHPLQLSALAAIVASLCFVTSFALGQSSLITIPLLGAFWCLIPLRSSHLSLGVDLILAILFWALCLKPSVALIPFVLLVGSRAWRVVAFSLILLLATWGLVAGRYGGWWTSLWDYQYLLNHYNNADFTPYMQRSHLTPPDQLWTHLLFLLDRALILIFSLTLLFLRWTQRITASDQFQGTVWAFLLFSPYLLPTEDWILCLLVVEGTFFHSRNLFGFYGKLFLLVAVMNLWTIPLLPGQIHFLLKCALFAWILSERLRGWRVAAAKNMSNQPVASAKIPA